MCLQVNDTVSIQVCDAYQLLELHTLRRERVRNDFCVLLRIPETEIFSAVPHAYIAVSTPSGRRILLRPDFTCYETYVEGTDADGELLTLTYEQIESVDVE